MNTTAQVRPFAADGGGYRDPGGACGICSAINLVCGQVPNIVEFKQELIAGANRGIASAGFRSSLSTQHHIHQVSSGSFAGNRALDFQQAAGGGQGRRLRR